MRYKIEMKQKAITENMGTPHPDRTAISATVFGEVAKLEKQMELLHHLMVSNELQKCPHPFGLIGDERKRYESDRAMDSGRCSSDIEIQLGVFSERRTVMRMVGSIAGRRGVKKAS